MKEGVQCILDYKESFQRKRLETKAMSMLEKDILDDKTSSQSHLIPLFPSNLHSPDVGVRFPA